MNTKNELLEKLIVMPDVQIIEKREDIQVRLSTKFNDAIAQRFIDVLKGYKWSIEHQYECLIKVIIPEKT